MDSLNRILSLFPNSLEGQFPDTSDTLWMTSVRSLVSVTVFKTTVRRISDTDD